jgi:hypothetical protein
MKTYRYLSDDKRTIVCSDGRFIPADPGNRDYAELLASKEAIADYVPSPPPAPVPSVAERLVDALAAEGVITASKATAIKARLR